MGLSYRDASGISPELTHRAHSGPKGLVLLELEPDRQAGFEDPGGQLGGIDLAEGGAEQDGAAVGQPMRADDVDGPVEIGAVADDKLDLVDRLEPVEVAPDVGLDLARAGRLDVEDHADPGIDRAVSIAPLVSSRTVLPASASRVMSG